MAENLYSWDEIKQKGDCIRYVQEILGLPIQDDRCAATWRNGDNPQSVSLERDRYYDHGAKQGGSIIDLCAVSKFNGDFFAAASFLGDWMGLKAKETIHDREKLIATYRYVDPATGAVVHEELRFRVEGGGKKIKQRRPDPSHPGKHIYNLDGIEPILYRMSDWVNGKRVVVVEGPKCADALAEIGIPATTNPMGAGYWRETYNQQFAGKVVAILPDNDDAGIIHARHIADSILPLAKAVKVVQLPGLLPAEDVHEYLHKYNHTKDELISLINAAPLYVQERLNEPSQAVLADASAANDMPLQNYQMRKIASADGADEKKPDALPINGIVSDIRRRFFGFPHRIGETLFDHDRKSNQIVLIRDCNQLFAWISAKSGSNYRWRRFEGAVSREEVYASIYQSAKQFQMISGVPHWPLRDDVYYTYGALPEPRAGLLDGFLDLFSFSTPEDRALYKVFLATLIYYRPKVDRPIWVFDSEDGQGTGKTKAAEYAALLVGGDDPDCGEPLWVDYKQLETDQAMQVVVKRLLSASGRKKRVFLLDNVEGYFRSPALATLVTQGSISGMAPYGHGEETRPNDLVYVVTCNSATLSRDILSRSMIINMRRAESSLRRWNDEVEAYIKANRMGIVSELVALLEAGLQYDLVPATRFATWERDVMGPVLQDSITLDEVWKHSERAKMDSDADAEEAEIISETVEHKVADYVQNQDEKVVWLQSAVLADWVGEAIPGFGGQFGRNVRHKLKNLCKVGLIPRMRFFAGASKFRYVRGVAWIGKDASDSQTKKPDVMLRKLPSGQIDVTSIL